MGRASPLLAWWRGARRGQRRERGVALNRREGALGMGPKHTRHTQAIVVARTRHTWTDDPRAWGLVAMHRAGRVAPLVARGEWAWAWAPGAARAVRGDRARHTLAHHGPGHHWEEEAG